MNKVYSRINWENEPSTKTPLNEHNLNKIDFAVDEIDNRVIELDSTKAKNTDLQTLSTRVDNLILNAGDSSAECTDARVTEDGTTYDTLKKRLDAEHSSVTEDISQLSDDLDGINKIVNTDVTNTFLYEDTRYYDVKENALMPGGATYYSQQLEVGDKYTFTTKSGANIACYVLLNSSGTVVSSGKVQEAWDTEHDKDIVVEITEENMTLYVNGTKTTPIIVYKQTKQIENNLVKYESFDGVLKSSFSQEFKTSIVSTLNNYLWTDGTFKIGGNCIYKNVNKGEVYRFYTVTGAEVYSYILLNSDGSIYAKYPIKDVWETVHDNDIELVIPKDNLVLYINCINGYTPTLKEKRIISNNSISTDGLNPLFEKIAVFDGDSICHGTSVGSSDPTYGYGWAGRIGEKNSMNWTNYGISGGTITGGLFTLIDADTSNLDWDNKSYYIANENATKANERYTKVTQSTWDGTTHLYQRQWDCHSVSLNIDYINNNRANLDYLILEGGTNDADLLGEKFIGEISQTSCMYTDFDPNADFTQALEYLFSKSIALYPTKKIGFIIPQKMGIASSDYTHIRRIYFNRCIEVCKKYGIPYIDLWNGSHLMPELDYKTHNNTYYMYIDGQHLTAKGYDYITPMIESWMKTL